MKKFLLVLFFLLFSVRIFAQQFSLYNTGTLYDSFENPSQRAFIPDTSKMYASNFLIPNFNANLFLSGDAQATLKNRAFLNKYNNTALQIGKGKYNRVNENVNAYLIMLKMFSSLSGDEEMGFSWQMKSDGKGALTDESIAALNGTQSFTSGQNYTDIFNSNYYYQTYHQISFTYREKFNKQVAFGVKISALLGISYQKLNINGSQATFDKTGDSAVVALRGKYYSGYIPGKFIVRDYLPNLRSPGAAISMGATYRTEDNFILQGNIKDLGFIHWSSRSSYYNFNSSASIYGLTTPQREDSIYNKISKIVHTNQVTGSFTSPIDGRAEFSVSKSFWIDDNHMFKYSPTAVVSKELFYPGFIGALVNPFKYEKYSLTLTTTYDDLKIFNLGAQFMMQTPNWEFFIGSDKLTHSMALAGDQLNKKSADINQNGSYTGADFFIGFSLKLGPVIEHPMNASSIPMGEKGFLGRLLSRWFKTKD
ncbi:DUF5723 family protein [Mucilaginibacter sp.]|uniref:DUF5723 family protein n=1 Tax=Mucilaginibacter sp. TaxID=1882438 RepID=UPI00283CBFE4|nr:DUF5723 family protein [Mucilaginibacter sp.]MDR3696023.1 DUF5723 family protein [Mucilaginibacter sp.]